MTLFRHTLYLLFKYRYKVQTRRNFSSILRQTYDLELSTLAECKMDFFFNKMWQASNELRVKEWPQILRVLRRQLKKELQCCVKATIIWEQNLAKIASFRF